MLANFDHLMSLRKRFRPLSKRAVMLLSLLTALSSVQHEYRFSLGGHNKYQVIRNAIFVVTRETRVKRENTESRKLKGGKGGV